MKLFVAIWEDRHVDPQVRVFSSRSNAIGWAKAKAKECAREEYDYEEIQAEGFEFCATYSCEGDAISVVETELDEEI